MTLLTNQQQPISQNDIDLAQQAQQILAAHLESGEPLTPPVLKLGQNQSIELPTAAIAMLAEILNAIAIGKSAHIIPENAELSTFEAANLLSVSRPYLIKLLDAGKIPHRKVGRHRRILMKDLSRYKAQSDAESERFMDQLVAESQAMGLYDIKPE
jgi:excisionase family DNA binding protein